MGDLVFVSVVVAFFALMVGLVALCDRVIGPESASDLAVAADGDAEAEAVVA